MYKSLFILLSLLVCAVPSAQALRDTLIEVELPRRKERAPVFLRAILPQPDTWASNTALLFFRGGHGMAKISSIEDGSRDRPMFIGPRMGDFSQSGIAMVGVDCPTDQWGRTDSSHRATRCLDGYRTRVPSPGIPT